MCFGAFFWCGFDTFLDYVLVLMAWIVRCVEYIFSGYVTQTISVVVVAGGKVLKSKSTDLDFIYDLSRLATQSRVS